MTYFMKDIVAAILERPPSWRKGHRDDSRAGIELRLMWLFPDADEHLIDIAFDKAAAVARPIDRQ